MSWTKQVSGNLKCGLCPHNCLIQENSYGICSVRFNNKGRLDLPLKGHLSALNIDPVEKKPLYHFYPGSQVLSLGFFGCNLHCQFCQNYQISQYTGSGSDTGDYSPEQLINICIKKEIPIIGYTYSEPLIHFEYIMECAEKASEKGIKNILVTNGFINQAPGAELLKVMNGVNIDLKSFSGSFYRKLGGRKEPVLKFIELASELSHTEVTTLIIPEENDSYEEITKIAGFIGEIDKTIPLHISRYYPAYNYSLPAGNIDHLKKLADMARKYLGYVYPGNIGIEDNNTICQNCGSTLVFRSGYTTEITGISGKSCSNCNTVVPFPV